jgi:hypothetical protein
MSRHAAHALRRDDFREPHDSGWDSNNCGEQRGCDRRQQSRKPCRAACNGSEHEQPNDNKPPEDLQALQCQIVGEETLHLIGLHVRRVERDNARDRGHDALTLPFGRIRKL